MLAYAANRRLAGKRQSSPHAMLLIVSSHVALLAAVMSAKMEMTPKAPPLPPLISIPIQQPPPPSQGHPPTPHHTQDVMVPPVTDPPPLTPPIDPPPAVDQGMDPGVVVGGDGFSSMPTIPTTPVTAPIRHEPRLLTPLSELKPPYPASKLASEEEASLRLRVTIDDKGRVKAVDPIGIADREFLEAARRYMIAHWRYQAATEDGRAVPATEVVTLRFQLDG